MLTTSGLSILFHGVISPQTRNHVINKDSTHDCKIHQIVDLGSGEYPALHKRMWFVGKYAKV